MSVEISRLLGPTFEKNASAFGTTKIKLKITPVQNKIVTKKVFEKIASFSDLYNPGAIKLRICQINIGSETKKAIKSTSFKGIKNGDVTSIAIRVF